MSLDVRFAAARPRLGIGSAVRARFGVHLSWSATLAAAVVTAAVIAAVVGVVGVAGAVVLLVVVGAAGVGAVAALVCVHVAATRPHAVPAAGLLALTAQTAVTYAVAVLGLHVVTRWVLTSRPDATPEDAGLIPALMAAGITAVLVVLAATTPAPHPRPAPHWGGRRRRAGLVAVALVVGAWTYTATSSLATQILTALAT